LPQGRAEARGELGAARPFALTLDAALTAKDKYAVAGVASGTLAEPLLRLDAQGQGVRGKATVTATPFAALALKTVEVDVDEVDPATFAAHWPHAALRLHARLSAADEGGKLALRGSLSLANARPQTLDVGGLPLKTLTARLTATTDEARFTDIALDTGKGTLTGTLALRRGKEKAIVYELDAALHALAPKALHAAAPEASIDLQLTASGALAPRPTATVRYALGEASRLAGRALAGSGHFKWDGGAQVRDADLNLDFAGNRVKLAGAWGEAADRLAFDIDAPRLAAAGFGLDGRLRASGEASGGWDTPAGTANIDAARLRLPGNVAVASLGGEARLAVGASGALALDLKAAGVVAGDARIASLHLVADGQRDRHRLDIAADGKYGGEAVGLLASAEGGYDGGRWRGRVLTATTSGRWSLRLLDAAALEAGAGEFALGAATLAVGDKGRLELTETRWTRAAAVLRGQASGLAMTALPGLARASAPGLSATRRDPLVLGGRWDLRLGDTVEGSAFVQREAGDLTVRGEIATRLGLDLLEAHLSAHGRRATLALAMRGRESGEIGLALEAEVERVDGQWRLAPHAPMSGGAHLDMPSLAWLGRLLRENADIGGSLTADFDIAGTPAAPDLRGSVSGRELAVAFVDQGLMLSGGELDAGFTHRDGRQNLHLTRLTFASPNRVKPADNRVPYAELTAEPGRLDVSGDVALGALEAGETQRGQFAFTAERLPLLQRADRWLIVSGDGKAALQGKALTFDAKLKADAGFIKIDDTPPPTLGDDVVVHRRGADTTEVAAADAVADDAGGLSIGGKIALGLGDALYLDAFGVDSRLAGNLEVEVRPDEAARALGVIRTVDGAWRGYGQRLAIERGTLTFAGDAANPALNIVAWRRGMEVDAGVAITGDVSHPQVKLVSEPTVPDPEKLSWLILGRAPDAAGADLGLLMPAAQALFGGTGGGMTEELARGLGFDSITVGQGDLNSSRRSATSKVVGGGSTISAGPATANDVVAVGKRLTNDLSLSFEQSLGGAESLVKLTYRLSRRLSFVARGGTDNALDVYYTFSFWEGWRKEREKRRKE
jgi:translocation and assembly module TamB